MSLESRAVRWALVFTVVAVLQVALAPRLVVFGVHPDLLLLLTVVAGLTGGPASGAVIGFVAGLIADLYLSTRFGVGALSATLTGYVAGVAGDTVVRPTPAIWIASVAALSAGGTLLYATLGQLLGSATLADPNLVVIVGIVAVTNAALCIPAMAVCRWAGADHSAVRIR